MKKHLRPAYAAFIFVFLFSACSGLVQKSGEFLEGKAFEKKTVSLFQSEGRGRARRFEIRELVLQNGERMIEIKDSSVPGLVLRGNVPEADGTFDLVEADFLSTHYSGWNEFTLGLIGSARVRKTEDELVLQLPSPVERVQISTGRIRLKGSRISGADALRNLRNRRERILAVVEWMQERPGLPVFENQKDFENFWKRLLFPELVSKSRRPGEYSGENADWIKADEIKWNADYTEYLFPEWLWELRNSGAMLRDWEEAAAWFYLEYQWDSIISAFDGIVLKKIKGD